ncbi:MAG: hypothetical protein EP330_16430 [Deltaproteobacteria bacterium]|nr:MAG: hypothetical protein EP330_16430 [Deltaproteobacteria bacterium]
MTLPAPHYTKIGLAQYLETVPLPLPVPPGAPSTWTTALHLFGTFPLVAKDDRGYTDILDKDLLREILSAFGRPTRKEEQMALMFTTPIPGDVDVAEVLGGLLSHSTYWVRQRTAILIGLMGLTGAQKQLIANLSDSDNDARRGAAEGLGRLGDAGAIEALARGPWEDSDTSVDYARCIALSRINDWDRTAAAVAGMSADGDGFELLTAMIEAHKSGDGSELIERMESGDDDVKRAVGRFLMGHPAMSAKHAGSLGEVMSSIDDTDAMIPVAYALGFAGEDAVGALEELFDSGDWRVRQGACMAASRMGAAGMALKDKLVATLSDDDGDVQRDAALACTILGIQPETTGPKWQNDMSTSYQFAFRAAELSKTEPGAALAGQVMGLVPPTRDLFAALGSGSGGNADTRGYAAAYLALLEPELMSSVLDAMARDDSRDVPMGLRRWAAAGFLLTGGVPSRLGAMHRILLAHEGEVSSQPKGSVENLRGRAGELASIAAKDGDWPVRIDALRLLQLLGNEAAPFKDLIHHISIHDSDSDCRNQARDMIDVGWTSESVADFLAGVIAGPRGGGDSAKAASLKRLAGADPALGALMARRFASGDDRDLARAGSTILGGVLTAANAVPEIEAALGRLEADGWVLREAACDLLGAIDPSIVDEGLFEEFCEALNTRAEEDDDSDVQNAAKAALARLGRPFGGE